MADDVFSDGIDNLFGDSNKFLALGRGYQAVRGLLDSGEGNDEVNREHQREQSTDDSASKPSANAEDSATDVGKICRVTEKRNDRVEGFLNVECFYGDY